MNSRNMIDMARWLKLYRKANIIHIIHIINNDQRAWVELKSTTSAGVYVIYSMVEAFIDVGQSLYMFSRVWYNWQIWTPENSEYRLFTFAYFCVQTYAGANEVRGSSRNAIIRFVSWIYVI